MKYTDHHLTVDIFYLLLITANRCCRESIKTV